jgi:hypothetical protein
VSEGDDEVGGGGVEGRREGEGEREGLERRGKEIE